MAEEEGKAAEQAKPKGKGGLIIILLLLVIIAGGAFAAKQFLFKAPAPAEEVRAPEPAAQGGGSTGSVSPSAAPGPVVSYAPFIVNLADPGGNRYLRTTIALELSKEKDFLTEVTAKEPKIKDIILSILSSKKFEEVNTAQGKVALKQEILRRLNTIMSGGRIMDIYITEFVVQ